MKRLLLIVFFSVAPAANAAVTIDGTACSSSLLANCPTASWTTNTTSAATASFSTTNAVEIIYVMVSCADFNSRTATVTSSGGSFSTSLTKILENVNQYEASLWYAVTSSALSSVTFTLTMSALANSCLMTVVPFSTSLTTNTGTHSVGAAGGTTGYTNTETISLTTSANSLMIFQGSDSNSPHTAFSGSTTMALNVTAGWNGYSTSLTSAGTTTLGTTSSRQWAGAAVEVCDSGGCGAGGGGGGATGNWGGAGFWGSLDLIHAPLSALAALLTRPTP